MHFIKYIFWLTPYYIKKKMAGLYIHIPFCESRCIYCGFYSTTSLKLRDAYVDALCKEMQIRPIRKALGDHSSIETIYLGGGTPSLLTSPQLIRLFESIRKVYLPLGFSPLQEITMECNPDDVTEDFCKTLQRLPVNRVSMGVQSFSDDRLRFIHRRHNAEETKSAIKRLRDSGIQNISIDLMFGFPGETLEEWKADIDEAIHLDVEHISAYSLMYEEGTPLYTMLKQGKVTEIDEEASLQMYETLIILLTENGYEHYEISNFARPGFRSRHNSSYWHEVPYIGIGAAAHSYKRELNENARNTEQNMITTRSWNVSNIHQYISSIDKGILPSECETLDLQTRYNDLITTALRTSDGIDIEKMQQEFGRQYATQMIKEAEIHIQRGLMKNHNGKLSLTRQGLYISDDIMSDFMIV